MKFCSFSEVKNIEKMCEMNPYIFAIIDPSCGLPSSYAPSMNTHDLQSVKRVREDERATNMHIPSINTYAYELYQKDLLELQGLLDESGFTRSLHTENKMYPIHSIDSFQKKYVNELYNAYRSGTFINVKKVIADLKNKGYSKLQKLSTLTYYNSLLEYGYVNWIYTFICQKIQLYIGYLKEDVEHTKDLDSLFGNIYQEYILPSLLKLQERFIDFKVTEKCIAEKRKLFSLERINQPILQLEKMDVNNFDYAISLLGNSDTVQITENEIVTDTFEQSYEDKLNSILHLLVAYNKKVQQLLGPGYSVRQHPFKSFEELQNEYEKLSSNQNTLDEE